jgi:hypothetical protein
MVSIIENRASIEGVVLSISENPALKGYLLFELELKRSNEVESFPNLAKADEGNIIRINVRPDQLADKKIKPGDTFSCNVRKAFGQVYFVQ